MTSWIHPRLICLSAAEAVGAKCDCTYQVHRHAALFRAELVNADTGEVHRQTLCCDRAKAFALHQRLEFPPWHEHPAGKLAT